MWQRLKQGDHLFFDSAIAVPPADFRQHYRIFHLLDKTNVAQHEVIMELRGIEAKNKAEIKKLKASITQKNKQIRDLKAQLSAKKS